MLCCRSGSCSCASGRRTVLKPILVLDKNGKYLFSALASGNRNPKVPPAHVLVEVEILKQDANGRVTEWEWNKIAETTTMYGDRIVCTPLNANRKPVTFRSVSEAAAYLGVKEYEIQRHIHSAVPCRGYKITAHYC